MRKLLLRIRDYRMLARMAKAASEKTLEDVRGRNARVDEVAETSRILRDENHFKETIKAAMQW